MEIKMVKCRQCENFYDVNAKNGNVCPHCGCIGDTIGETLPVDTIPHPIPDTDDNSEDTEAAGVPGVVSDPVVAWLVCIEGPMRGRDFRMYGGYNYIGRSSGEIIIPDDKQISRAKHAVVSYYDKRCVYYVGPAEGRNIIELNDEPVFNTVEMKAYDVLTVGNTKLMLVPLCGPHFSWTEGVKNEK